MIIDMDDFKARVKALWPNVQFSQCPRSYSMFAFAAKFMEDDFASWWGDYKKARGLVYIANSGMCDMFAGSAWVESNRSVLAWAALQPEENRDVVSSAVEVRISIPTIKGSAGSLAAPADGSGYTLNGIPGGSGHSTTLVAIHNEKETDYDLFLWEPQTEQFYSAKQAAADGIVVFDCCV